jgi:hypothetical protein
LVTPCFGPQEILPGGDHRDADRGKQDRRHQVRAPAVVGGRLLAVVIGILRDVVDPGAVVVRLGVVDRLRGPFGEIPRRPLQIIFQLLRRAAAAHVVAHEIAVAVVPRRPAGVAQRARDVPAETPRLGDQDHVVLHAFEGHLDLAQHVHAQQLREVEAEAVHAVRLDQMPAAVDDEALRHGRPGPHVVAAAAPIGELSGGSDLEVIKLVDEHQGGGTPTWLNTTSSRTAMPRR